MAISVVDDKSIKEAVKILGEFNLSNLPPSNFAEGKVEELANTWNAKQGVSIVTAKERLLDDGKEVMMDAEGAWTDRDREGPIIGLKMKTRKYGGRITQMMSLHGSQWGDLRKVGGPREDDDEETEIIMKPTERINGIRTWSSPDYGRLNRIEVTTNQGREFSAGKKWDDKDVPSHHLSEKKVLKFNDVIFLWGVQVYETSVLKRQVNINLVLCKYVPSKYCGTREVLMFCYNLFRAHCMRSRG